MDEGVFSKIFSAAAGVWAMAAMAFVALFKAWPLVMERINERRRDDRGERSGDWSRLRDEIARLSADRDKYRDELDACREREAEWMKRAIAAEAALIGRGEAKQEAQRLVSDERTEGRVHLLGPSPVTKPKDEPDGE